MKAASSLLLVGLAAISSAQAWRGDYQKGLDAARTGQWGVARAAFQSALTTRPTDSSEATTLPGPVTERRQWREGAPYSANFLAAYSGYQAALTQTDPNARNDGLRVVAGELQTLVDRRMAGPTAFVLLADVYTRLGDTPARAALQQKGYNAAWREDLEIVAPELVSTAQTLANPNTSAAQPIPAQNLQNPGGTSVVTPTTNPAAVPGTVPAPGTVVPSVIVGPAPILGGTPTLSNKYALIIGNGMSKLEGNLEFANDDAMRLRDELQNYGGYPTENIEMAVNATASAIRSAAKALASRMGPRSVVLVYYTGVGVNLNGQDYLAGVDAESATDVANMMPKQELFNQFTGTEASVFAFFQTNRPLVNGRFFGSNYPVVGQIAQAQATQPEGTIGYTIRDGRKVGLYTDAFCAILREFRTNQIPVNDFAWQVFYRMRRGDNGSIAGSSQQVPTLPVLNQLGSNARF